ncbi:MULTISPECIES: hypothetical protein [unclassified Cupriavidus]|uniref:hypothetical protein n=1 Tax=unclassified Cupriavidus TaxID=2640874 RepID=UPI003F926725
MYQLFVSKGCPACATLVLFMQDAGLEHEVLELESPRHAAEVLPLLGDAELRCPALSIGGECATGLADCLQLLATHHPALGTFDRARLSAAQRDLVDGVLSSRMLMARTGKSFSAALLALADAMREWTACVSQSRHHLGLAVPYFDLGMAGRLASGSIRVWEMAGLQEAARQAASRFPRSFENEYLDRLRRKRSWVYWSGAAGLAGAR